MCNTDFQRQLSERASTSRIYVPCPSSALLLLTGSWCSVAAPVACVHATGIVCDTCSSGRQCKPYEGICVRAGACFFIRTPVLPGWNYERATVTWASIGAPLVAFWRPAQLWRCSTYSATCLSSPTLFHCVRIGSVFLRYRLHDLNWWIIDEEEKIAREGESYFILLV